MSTELGYYRHPTISGNDVIFICEDDLWLVSVDGGIARRLTANPGTSSFPAFSPDGKSVAFSGRDDGPSEVYLMPSRGGQPKRLSWFGSNTQVIGWSSEKGILASTDWRQPFAGHMHLIAVSERGSPPEFLGLGPARALSFGPDSKGLVIGRNSGDPARWKRYHGGTAGTLWIDRTDKGRFSPLIKLEGNLASPIWIGSRIYFLSDHEGHGNLYSCTSTGRELKRHTHHTKFYVRFPSTDGSRIVYHAGADIYLFDPQDDKTRKIEVQIHSSRNQRNRKFVTASRYMESFDLHPTGHTVATVHRGGLFAMGLWEGASVRFGKISSARYRLGTWLPTDNKIVAVTDEGGLEHLILFSQDSMKELKRVRGDFGRVTGLYPAPGDTFKIGQSDELTGQEKNDSKKRAHKKRIKKNDLIALTNNRHELILVNLTTGKSNLINRSAHHRIGGVDWSPDSSWIAFGCSTSERSSSIRLYELATGKTTTLTRPDFFDVSPSFDPDGKYLYFISWRIFNPVYDSHYFDLGFPKGSRPYMLTLRKDMPSPFSLATRKPRAPGGTAENANQENSNKEEPLKIDLKGIQDRIVAFPLPEGRYDKVLGTFGRALFSRFPAEGALLHEEGVGSGLLEFWDFETDKVGRVSDKANNFSLSLDRKVLALRSGHDLRVLPATYKEDPEKNKEEYTRETGWINLDRIRATVIPTDEWKQMYGEAWRLQREQFWRSDMSGVDWQEVYQRYLPLLERLGSRTEFSDLMWELQGELGTSHCYEMGGDYRPRPNWSQGFIGADLEYNKRSKRWQIKRIPRGDSWDSKYVSPLAVPGINLNKGDEILAVGGETVDANVSPYERLVHLADKEVQLTVQNRGRNVTSRNPRTVTVKTLIEETSLRYRDWVESNRSYVHTETNGQVGYVHIPDMGPFGYSEFHRYYGQESIRDGLIIDVRFNRGGHVSQLLLEKLVRRRIGYDVSRWAEPTPYPDASPMGPMIALTNEYAGSDGDIFCHAFKLFKLGPLIGKRTWGGVIGIWPRAALVDGTITTQPEYASWFEDVGYGVENYGTDPDIEIDIRPQDYQAGHDRQMEKGLKEIRRLVRKSPKKPKLKDF